MEIAPAQKNILLKNARANAISNFFKRVFFSPPKKEFQNIFFQPFKKIKTPDTQALTMQTADTFKHDNWTTEKKHMPITAPTRNWRFSSPQTHLWSIKHWFSASTFVVKIANFL